MAASVARKVNLRVSELSSLLARERAQAVARVGDFRRDQSDDVVAPPGDEMDVARSLAEVETHASLIERSQERLRAIDAAIDRLAEGRFGICAKCGEDIPLTRLRVVPFAECCVDCQQEINSTQSGRGALSRSFAKRWTPPEEVDESGEQVNAAVPAEEDLHVHFDSAFGPEEGELEEAGVPKRRRGRPPKNRDAAERRAR